jgi:hypothetical protein
MRFDDADKVLDAMRRKGNEMEPETATVTSTEKTYDELGDEIRQQEAGEGVVATTALDPPACLPPLSDESELARMHAWEMRLLKQRATVAAAQKEVDELSEELKGARKILEDQNARLLGIIDEIEQPPLFAELAPAPAGGADLLKAEFDAATIGQIGIDRSLSDKLEADGIRNGKDLRTWFNGVPRRKIAGIGWAKCDKIQEIMAKWWELKPNPDPTSAAATDVDGAKGEDK